MLKKTSFNFPSSAASSKQEVSMAPAFNSKTKRYNPMSCQEEDQNPIWVSKEIEMKTRPFLLRNKVFFLGIKAAQNSWAETAVRRSGMPMFRITKFATPKCILFDAATSISHSRKNPHFPTSSSFFSGPTFFTASASLSSAELHFAS